MVAPSISERWSDWGGWYTGFGEASLVHYVKQRTQECGQDIPHLGCQAMGLGATESPFHYEEEVKARQLRVP